MPREATLPRTDRLDELKTIQLLEESVGPRSLRDLRTIVPGEDRQRVLSEVARDASDVLRQLDDLIHDWTLHTTPPERREKVTPGLDREEILSSVIELKESEAQILRRAAETAPTDEIRERLNGLADRTETLASRLHGIV